MDPHSLKFDYPALKSWFGREKRDLPWRKEPNPYAVWISEIMLQQTQVSVVIPYYEKWMKRFPTVEALAESPLDEVIKMWEGLGYYSRARNLHEGARYIVRHFGGQIPDQETELTKIKGLGPYTVGALLSFAFRQKSAAVDANVIRVRARYFQIEMDVSKPSTVQFIRQVANNLLPENESWIFNEGLIELGATVCQRKPKCHQCPLKNTCQSFLHGTMGNYPIKSKHVQTTQLYRAVAVITDGHNYLVRRGKEGEIMQDLHEFPYFDTAEAGWPEVELREAVRRDFQLHTEHLETLPSVSHSFTRYQVRLNPVLLRSDGANPLDGMNWMSVEEMRQSSFSSGHRRICHQALARNAPNFAILPEKDVI